MKKVTLTFALVACAAFTVSFANNSSVEIADRGEGDVLPSPIAVADRGDGDLLPSPIIVTGGVKAISNLLQFRLLTEAMETFSRLLSPLPSEAMATTCPALLQLLTEGKVTSSPARSALSNQIKITLSKLCLISVKQGFFVVIFRINQYISGRSNILERLA